MPMLLNFTKSLSSEKMAKIGAASAVSAAKRVVSQSLVLVKSGFTI